MGRNAVSMGIRWRWSILAVILQSWITWVLLAAAVILPDVAVDHRPMSGPTGIWAAEQSEDLDARPP